MTLEEARAIVMAEDDSDTMRALEAIATVLRFESIAQPKYLRVAELVESAMDPKLLNH